MKKKNHQLISREAVGMSMKTLLILFLVFSFYTHYAFGTDISVWPYEIKFNYEAGQSNDAITILDEDGDTAPVPEWEYNGGSAISEKFAYIKSQSSRKIQVRFDSNCDSMHLLINLNVVSGTGIGEVCNYFVANYDKLDWITLTLDGTIPSSIDTRNFTWTWTIYAISKNSSYCSDECTSNTQHTYYTLLDVPKSPETEPRVNILDYACDWSTGSSTENQVCTNILSNGFNQHYTWDYQCHLLASDFVRLVSSLGINAYLHRWSSKGLDVGDMSYQLTREFDPVGPTHGYDAIPWAWHQWAEAASYQRDPSANNSVAGNWGAYEDYLFTHYERIIANYPYYEWVENQSGQSLGCEAEGNRYYWYYPTYTWLLTSWRGPDR